MKYSHTYLGYICCVKYLMGFVAEVALTFFFFGGGKRVGVTMPVVSHPFGHIRVNDKFCSRIFHTANL